MYVVSTAESGAVNGDIEHAKKESDEKALNKEVRDEITKESNSNETEIENHVPNETKSVKNIDNKVDENKNYVDRPDKEDAEKTKLSCEGPGEGDSEKKVVEPEKGQKPFDISTLKTEKEVG